MLYLIKEDWLPKRPTPKRIVGALPHFGLALAFFAGFFPWTRWDEAALQTLGVEGFLLVMMFVVVAVSGWEGRFLKFAVMGWYAVAFCGLFVAYGYVTGTWWPVAAGVMLLAAKGRTLVMRDRFVEREMLFFRTIVSFALLWVMAMVGALLSLAIGVDDGGMYGWGAGYFALLGLMEYYGILTPAFQKEESTWGALFRAPAEAVPERGATARRR